MAPRLWRYAISEIEQPILNIVGEHVSLGPLRRDLFGLYHRWQNDFAVGRTLHPDDLYPLTMEQIEADPEKDMKSQSFQSIHFTVFGREPLRPVGMASLFRVNQRNRSAIFGIGIGEADARGKGLGTEATRLVLDYAFTALGLHNVMLMAAAYNHAAIRAYTKAGYREFGRQHECLFMGGRLWDTVYMECLATDFVSPVLAQVLWAEQP